jgi:hypothetical protein
VENWEIGTLLYEQHKKDGRWGVIKVVKPDGAYLGSVVLVYGTIYDHPSWQNNPSTSVDSHNFDYREISEEELLIYKLS